MKTTGRMIFLLLFLFQLTHFLISEESGQILVMHSYHQGLEWTDNISRGIIDTFREEEKNYEIFFEYLDTKRNPSSEYFERLVEFEKQKTELGGLNFDLIICSDNNALTFLSRYGKELFGEVPIVFCGVNNYTPAMRGGNPNITGLTEAIDFRSNLTIMRQLHPQRSHILFIVDRTRTGDAVAQELLSVIEQEERDYSYELLRDFSLNNINRRLEELGPKDIIYLLVMNLDSNGTFISYHDAIEKVRRSAEVPIYGSWDFFFGKGLTGGMIISAYNQGVRASEIGLDILNGTSPEEIPVEKNSGNQLMFDHRELTRFGIDVKDLPPDSLVSFRPESFLQRNRYTLIILLSLSVFFVLSLIINGLYQRLKTKRLEEMNLILDQRVKEALSQVNTLNGLLPICARCKKIRDDSGYWNQLETYIKKHSDADFSHGLCPDCAAEIYPKHFPKGDKK
jgi:ABC-type uncharacterized transport system substrate-binding protein